MMRTRAKVVRLGRLWMLSLLPVIGLGLAYGQDASSVHTPEDKSPRDLALISAVRHQDKSAIADLLEQKVDVNASQPDGATALHWAVHRDDLETAKLLIKAGADVESTNDFGVMPLSLACTNGSASIVELLLSAGADANTPLLTGETPLMTAAHTGNLQSVEVLLGHGADVNAKEPIREQTALMRALGEKQTDVVRKLIEHGADINATTTLGFTPLLFAARRGDLDATKMLLDAGACVNAKSKDKLSTLHVAAQRGHVDVAIELLKRGADANDDGPGYTALHWAVGTWETEMNGANGMTAPKDHEWNRMRGIQEGKFELVKALLEHGADPNARMKKSPVRFGFTASRPPQDSTPFTLAAFAGEGKIMRLLAEHGADPTLRPKNRQSALLIAAGVNRSTRELSVSTEDLLEAVKVAVELGADVNETDPSGNTALHGAAWLRSVEIVQYLVDKGADVNAKNKSGKSPLHIADHSGFVSGSGAKIERLPVGHLLHELSVPGVVKQSIEQWPNLPPHIRKAVKSLLQGELEKLNDAKKK